MTVALLVSTVSRKEPLRLLLESLRQQTFQDFNILLADKNPSGFLEQLLEDFSDLPIRRVPMPLNGLSESRNHLLRLVEGDIIAFPDDDCFYAPDTLQKVTELFTAHPEYDAIIGCWSPAGSEPGLKSGLGQVEEMVSRWSACRRCESYTQFYREALVKSVGLFDTAFGPSPASGSWSAEDSDYLIRALDLSAVVQRSSAVRIFHPVPDTANPVAAQKIASYGRARMQLLRKHNFSLLFKLANVLYPLAMLFYEGGVTRRYRWAMFRGRLRGLFEKSV